MKFRRMNIATNEQAYPADTNGSGSFHDKEG
jgi:hypothetical protein